MASLVKRLKRMIVVSSIINIALFLFLVSSLMLFWDFVSAHKIVIFASSLGILLVAALIGFVQANNIAKKLKARAGYR